MLWLALHFPRLALDCAERALSTPAGPLALADRLTLLAVNEAARAQGIHPGIRRATALALQPGLTLLEHDPALERSALAGLAGWAQQFTPGVVIAPPPCAVQDGTPGLLLDIGPSLRLFGGLSALHAHVQNGLLGLGYHGVVGIASTATAAWLFAQQPDAPAHHSDPTATGDRLQQRLADLPITVLSHARAHHDTLVGIGAHTLGALLELPRAGLARRFGKALLQEIDCALGLQPEPMAFFEAPAHFATRLELPADIEQSGPLLFAANRLLLELAGWLRARQAATRGFDLLADHHDGLPTALSIRLTDASRDPVRFTTLLRERLGILQLRAPVRALRLSCTRVQSQPLGTTELFPTPAAAQENLGRLLERLQIRLGREQVQRLHVAEDHRPEDAYRVCMVDSLERIGRPAQVALTAIETEAPQTDRPASGEAGSLPRPLWLLREPRAITERNNRPWLQGPLTVLAGPERIETGWWDNSLVQRDYFIAADDGHQLYWVYRERGSQDRYGWFLQGLFG